MLSGATFYKVLGPNGESCNGGSLKWDLPKNNKPGKWHTVKGNLSLCYNGIHLTTDPWKWKAEGARLFHVEYKGQFDYQNSDKVCFRSVRLIKEITLKDKLLFADKRLYMFVWICAQERGEKVADLRYADLRYADLRNNNLQYANLQYANLWNAYGPENPPNISILPRGWKINKQNRLEKT